MTGLEKATLTNTVTGRRVPVQFNPGEYTINRDVTYAQAAVPGLSAPLLQFVHGGLQTLEMELFLDTYETHRDGTRQVNAAGDDVRPLLAQVTGLMDIDPTTHAPPVALFTWGTLSFTCVLARTVQRFVMFKPDGTPIRARVSVTFNELKNAELEAKEIKRETADYTKVRVVAQGETIAAIATDVYGDPTKWRPIAIRNRIDDPRSLPAGLALSVPRLPYTDPESGLVMR
ncbi:CIS tube protein [Cumulibacter manganitolerans]|uniref:CIS tube protein n=1 Tax=Cumulibacter manganitolerans TaxID=1884992 RepID=UPI001296699D|nr:peptigoglycan-binding protein LysM [Cumulibacter manganitolerans]